MSTHFSIFRRNQRAMMAILGVTCMVAFSLGGLASFGRIGSMMGGEGANPVVASTIYGDYRETDVSEMRSQRLLAKRFLLEAMTESIEPHLRRFAAGQIEMMIEQRLIGPSTERAVIDSRILAKQAEAEGIVVSDEAVSDFIRALTQDQVTANQLQAIVSQMQGRARHRVTKASLYEALRIELLAMRYRELFTGGMTITPAQRWELYERLNRRVRAEIVALSASDFVGQVGDPSPAALTAFFDSHKNDIPLPGASEPGFKIPDRASFDYIEAHYDKFFAAIDVSEADIKAQYEKSKDTRYLYTELPAHELEEEEPKKEEPKKDAPPAAATPAAPATPAATTPPAAAPATPPAQTPPTTPAPATGGSPSGGAPGDAAPPAASAEPAKTTPPATDAPKSDAPVVDPPKTEAPKTEAPKTDAIEPPAEADKKFVPKVKPEAPPQLTDKYALPRNIRDGAKPKYEPLWKVQGEIRKELAGGQAAEKMVRALAELQGKLRGYTQGMVAWRQRPADAPKAEPPKAPDLEALIKNLKDIPEGGITVGHVTRKPVYELVDVPGLGKSTVNGIPFVDFGIRTLRPFFPATSQNTDGDRFLFWKTDEEKSRVPELAEVRGEVLSVWKLSEARKLAIKRAEELAEKANKARQSLKQVFADQSTLKVEETPAFSWMNTGSAGEFSQQNVQPQLSDVPGVVDPGDRFMQKVFDLRVGDVGVAVNQPESMAYVVRVTSSEPPLQVLHDLFLSDSKRQSPGLSALVNIQTSEIMRAWLNERIYKVAKLTWKREPYEEQARLE